MALNAIGQRSLISFQCLGFLMVSGEYPYKDELVEFTLLIERLDREFARMFIGVMADGHTFNSDNSFQGNAGAFGWAGVGQVQLQPRNSGFSVSTICLLFQF